MKTFNPDERRLLLDELSGGGATACPRCGGRLDRTDVPPRADVAYVRDRVWLVCRACARWVVLDRPGAP